MEKHDKIAKTGIKYCPVNNKYCLEKMCAWYDDVDKVCIVKTIAIELVVLNERKQ